MPLSRVFPATHPRKGEETHFEEKIFNEVYTQKRVVADVISGKIHTCRIITTIGIREYKMSLTERQYWYYINGQEYHINLKQGMFLYLGMKVPTIL